MALRQRIKSGTVASLTWQPVDSNGEPADPGGAVTVGVTRADGTVVLAAGTATSGSGAAVRTVSLTRAQTAQVDILTATWKVGVDVADVTGHDVVGGFYADTATLREMQRPHLDSVPAETLIDKRAEVESWFEARCSRAFVPRLDVETFDRPPGGTFTRLVLRHLDVRSVRWVRTYIDPTWTPLADLTRVEVNDSGVVVLLDGSTAERVEIGYEYGMDEPPADIVGAAAVGVRLAVASPRIRVDDFGQPFEVSDDDGRQLFGALKRWDARTLLRRKRFGVA